VSGDNQMSDKLCFDCKKQPINFERSNRCCSTCLDIRILRQNNYVKNNQEAVSKCRHKYYINNIDKIKEYHKNIDKTKARARYKKYRDENPDKVRERKRKCTEAKPELYAGISKRWRQNNLRRSNEILAKSTRKRRAELRGCKEHFTLDEWNELLKKCDYKCLNCGNTTKLEADHIIPLSVGGNDTIDNIQPLCRSCNAKKHIKTVNYKQIHGIKEVRYKYG
jgi:5-methylcytosine-specific restriction endonuclease McrA